MVTYFISIPRTYLWYDLMKMQLNLNAALQPSANVANSRIIWIIHLEFEKSNLKKIQCNGKLVFLLSDSSNVITIRFYSGCSGKCITLVSTVSSLWSIFRSNPRHLMVIIQYYFHILDFLICVFFVCSRLKIFAGYWEKHLAIAWLCKFFN